MLCNTHHYYLNSYHFEPHVTQESFITLTLLQYWADENEIVLPLWDNLVLYFGFTKDMVLDYINLYTM